MRYLTLLFLLMGCTATEDARQTFCLINCNYNYQSDPDQSRDADVNQPAETTGKLEKDAVGDALAALLD